MTRRLVYIIIPALFLFVGCRPKGILHSWEMRNVLIDLHKTDALLQISGVQNSESEVKAIYYAQVLEKHGITQAEFDSSLVWYTAHPQLFDKIYPKVMAQLTHEREVYYDTYSEELHLLPEAIDEPEMPVEHPFTPAMLDSMIWVNMHGLPSMWQPSMHNTEDQLLPKVCVLR